jgi:hypothetical protein
MLPDLVVKDPSMRCLSVITGKYGALSSGSSKFSAVQKMQRFSHSMPKKDMQKIGFRQNRNFDQKNNTSH